VEIHANKKRDTAPFIDNLKIIAIFKNENRKEEMGITDLIL